MEGIGIRIGVVAGTELQVWQRDALDRMRAAGARIVARFAPAVSEALPSLSPELRRLAGNAAAELACVPWDAPTPGGPDASELDAVLAFAPPADDRARLDAARWGCWDIVLPGRPPAFQAVERGSPTVQVRVERCAGGRAIVLAEATAAVDSTSYARTLGRVLALGTMLPLDTLRRCMAGVCGTESAAERPAAVAVDSRRVARLGRRCASRRIGGALRRRVLHARWRVGRLRTTPEALLRGEAPKIAWLDLPPGHFWADPFPLVVNGRVEVLLEGYDYSRDRGYLGRVALEGERVTGPVRELARPGHHISYPFVVEDGAARYVLPEESQRGQLALYEVDGDHLRESRVLIENFAAVDPTLIRRDGRWWLFAGSLGAEENSSLMLFFADSLDGPWQPHPLNPIVRDVRRARSAGTPFEVDGVLYRPGQDCSTGYGSRVALARVDLLTPEAYRETVVAHVAPPRRGAGRHGLHTFALRDGVCLVDGKDEVLDPAATWAIVRADIRHLLRRLDPRARSTSLVAEAPARS